MSTECMITFKVSVKTEMYQVVGIVGNQTALGNWNDQNAYKLTTDTDNFPIWKTENPLIVPRGTKLEFKFVILGEKTTQWEQLPQNRKYRARYCSVILSAEWDNYDGRELILKRFKSSVCLNQEVLQNYTRPNFSGEFNPFDQADNDSEDSIEGFDSFGKEQNEGQGEEDEDGDEEEQELIKQKNKKKLVKPTIHVDSNSDFQSLYSQYNENPRYKQLRSFNKNDILYEVNEDPIVGIAHEDCLLVATFYLPLVVHKKNGQYQVDPFQHSFSLHLQHGMKKLQCQKKWFGLLIAYNEDGSRIVEADEELIAILQSMNYYIVNIDENSLLYFNSEFCKNLYQPIMNNDVSVTKLSAIDYNEKMEQSYKGLNQFFFEEMKKNMNHDSIVFIADYRLIHLSSLVSVKYPRTTIAMFYNRLFPHLDNLKLIPFYLEFLNSFLQTDIICFSNYDTANQFLQILKDIYQIEFYSYKGNLAFHYYGREIYVKLQNPGIQCDLLDKYDKKMMPQSANEILIVGVDIYGHQSGVELKLKHLLRFIQETNIIQQQRNIKFIQLQLKAIEDEDVQIQRNKLQTYANQINQYLNRQFIELIEESVDSKQRFELFKRANIYIQTRYSGRHDFYLLEYIHLNKLPIALISDSSCYHRGCNSVHTFNVFSNQDFTTKFKDILEKVINQQYQFISRQKSISDADKEKIQNNQTDKWIESMYLDAKRAHSTLDFAKVSLRLSNGCWTKVAHSPKFAYLDLKEFCKVTQSANQKVIILAFETLVNDKFMIDYKPKHLLQSSPHYKPMDQPVILRQVDDEILDLIKQISKKHSVYIVSHGLYNELQQQFLNFKVNLFAEDGFLYREASSQQWNQLFNIDCQCINQIKKIFQQYAFRTEGAVVNFKESAISWVLKNQEEYASHLIQDLVDNIQNIIERYPNFQLIKKSNMVEVCPSNLNKGMIIELIMQKEYLQRGKIDFGFVLARGTEDEDMFSHLKVLKNQHKYTAENAVIYPVSLGLVPSFANFYIHTQKELIPLLKNLAQT